MRPDINEMLAKPAFKACGPYGSDMGRSSQTQGEPERLHLQKMRWVDGDYDTGGAYWGGACGDHIWAAFSGEESENDPSVMVFVRAKHLDEAKRLVLEELSGEGWEFITSETEPDEFALGYIAAALWLSNDDHDVPLDRNYDIDDLAPETLVRMLADCKSFCEANTDDLAIGPLKALKDSTPMEYAGHDMWLSRNGYGGFNDGDWPETIGERLYQAAKRLGEVNLYVGDDGLIYQD